MASCDTATATAREAVMISSSALPLFPECETSASAPLTPASPLSVPYKHQIVCQDVSTGPVVCGDGSRKVSKRRSHAHSRLPSRAPTELRAPTQRWLYDGLSTLIDWTASSGTLRLNIYPASQPHTRRYRPTRTPPLVTLWGYFASSRASQHFSGCGGCSGC